MIEVETHRIERDGRTYTARVVVDEDPSNPRKEFDHPATELLVRQYTYSRWDTYVDELDSDAGDALKHFLNLYGKDEKVERAFHLWTVITGSPVKLFTGQSLGYSQSDWHDWYALVDTDVMQREGYVATAQEVAEAEAEEYAAYAYGDVFGVIVTGEDDDEESLWGVVDRKGDYVREVIAELVDAVRDMEHDAFERLTDQANRVGAGFVGVI